MGLNPGISVEVSTYDNIKVVEVSRQASMAILPPLFKEKTISLLNYGFAQTGNPFDGCVADENSILSSVLMKAYGGNVSGQSLIASIRINGSGIGENFALGAGINYQKLTPTGAYKFNKGDLIEGFFVQVGSSDGEGYFASVNLGVLPL